MKVYDPAMLTVKQIIRRLSVLTWKERAALAKKAGLPFWTVQKIAIGNVADPRVSTFLALQKVLKK